MLLEQCNVLRGWLLSIFFVGVLGVHLAFSQNCKDISVTKVAAASNEQVTRATLLVKVQVPSTHLSKNHPFQNTVNITLGSGPTAQSATVTLTTTQPATVLSFSIFPHQATTATPLALRVCSTANITPAVNSLLTVEVTSEWRVVTSLEASGIVPSNLSLTATGLQDTKARRFSWTIPANQKPWAWELQLTKVEGDTLLAANNTRVRSKLDWGNATTWHLDGQRRNYIATISQGTGLYAWRVRAVGRSSTGQLNYGRYNCGTLSTVKIFGGGPVTDDSAKAIPTFYFADADSARNYTVSRTFFEDDILAERIDYFDGLNGKRQTQSLVPSKRVLVLQQAIADQQGRAALNVLPVPVLGDTVYKSYKTRLVSPRQAPSNLYLARHFDLGSFVRNPSRVDTTGLFGAYYNGRNGVAASQGLLFSRTLFSNDPSGRPREQALPGPLLGLTPSEDSSHTTKHVYATPTESELIALFGTDAPRSSAVEKQIVQDANGLKTVTYRTRDGRVIANSILSGDTTLVPLSKDALERGEKYSDGIRASKNIFLAMPSPLKLTFEPQCSSIDFNCVTLSNNCCFVLLISVSRVNGAIDLQDTTQWKRRNGGSTVVYRRDSLLCTSPALVLPGLNLQPGEYMIEKTLLPQGSGIVLTGPGEELKRQVDPIISLLTKWASRLKDVRDFPAFFQRVDTLSTRIDTVLARNRRFPQAATVNQRFTDLTRLYLLSDTLASLDSAYFRHVRRLVRTSTAIEIATACCPSLSFPLSLLPVFSGTSQLVDRNNNNVIAVNPYYVADQGNTEFTYDFEGYAYQYFWDCVSPDTAAAVTVPLNLPTGVNWGSGNDKKKAWYIYNRILKDKMAGYTQPGYLNLMVHNMLTSSYATDTTGVDSVQYKAKDLFACWVNQLAQLKERMNLCRAAGTGFKNEFNIDSQGTVSFNTDQQNGDNGSKQDADINNNIRLSKFMKWLMRKKLKRASERFRQMQPGSGLTIDPEDGNVPPITFNIDFHLVEEFLKCTGYRFAKIVTPVRFGPLAADSSVTFNYNQAALFEIEAGDISQVVLPAITINAETYKYKPNRNFVLREIDGGGRSTFKLYGVRDPAWAFKYYHYRRNMRPVEELKSCFVDPNMCDSAGVRVPCCRNEQDRICNYCILGKMKCPYDHLKWNADQRYNFQQLILSAAQGVAAPRIEPEALQCKDYESPVFVNDADSLNHVFTLWQAVGNMENLLPSQYNSLKSANFRLQGRRLPAKVELEISALNLAVVEYCESSRQNIKLALMDTLQNRGFTIDYCVNNPSDTLITEREIDQIVDALIHECKLRGQIRTYSYLSAGCRDPNAPTSPGATPNEAVFQGNINYLRKPISFNEIRFGSGNYSPDSVAAGRYSVGKMQVRQSINSNVFAQDTATLKALVYLDERRDTMTVPIYLDHTANPLECEATKRRQVMEMYMHISIPFQAGVDPDSVTQRCNPDPLAVQDTVSDCPGCYKVATAGIASASAVPMPTPDSYLQIKVETNTRNRRVRRLKRTYQYVKP